MGGVLCCIRKPSEDGDGHRRSSSSSPKASDRNNKRKYREPANSSEWKTLEDYFLNSPANTPCILGGDQGQKFGNLHKKVYPSSSPEDTDTSQEFFTPARSFSSTERLAKIEENGEDDDTERLNSASTTPSSRNGSGKLRKTVTFRLPEEADIFVYYSPRQKFEEAY